MSGSGNCPANALMHMEHTRYNDDVAKRRLGILAADEPKCDETELKRRLSVLQSILKTEKSTDRNKFLAMVDMFDTWQWADFGSECPTSEQISAMMQLTQPSHTFDGFGVQQQVQQSVPAVTPTAASSSSEGEVKLLQQVNTGPPCVSCESIT